MISKVSFSSYELKIMAMTLMFVDHAAALFDNHDSLIGLFLRFLGRGSAPLFAFVFCFSIKHSSSLPFFAKRLLIFAVISQLPFSLFNYLASGDSRDIFYLNILFTFFFTLVLFMTLQGSRKALNYLFIGCYFLFFIHFSDWGYFIPTWCLIFYNIAHRGIALIVFWTITIFLYCLLYDVHSQKYIIILGVVGSLVCAPFILYYNFSRGSGFLGQNFFYWFYPSHLCALSLVYLIGIFYGF